MVAGHLELEGVGGRHPELEGVWGHRHHPEPEGVGVHFHPQEEVGGHLQGAGASIPNLRPKY